MFFSRTRKIHPNIHLESQEITNGQNNLEKKNRFRGLTLPDFKMYHKPTLIKTVWY